MRTTLCTLILLASSVWLSGCCDPACSELSMEACEKAPGCAVERTYARGEGGQLDEDVACVAR